MKYIMLSAMMYIAGFLNKYHYFTDYATEKLPWKEDTSVLQTVKM